MPFLRAFAFVLLVGGCAPAAPPAPPTTPVDATPRPAPEPGETPAADPLIFIAAIDRDPKTPLKPLDPSLPAHLLGAARGGEWLDTEAAVELLTEPREYRWYALAGERGQSRGGIPWPGDYGFTPDGSHLVQFDGLPADDITVALSGAAHDPFPRPVTLGEPDETDREAVQAVLRENGLPDAPVRITQLARADLDGDGHEEVVLHATTYRPPDPEIDWREWYGDKRDDHSIILVRKRIGGELRSLPLESWFRARDQLDDPPPGRSLAAVLDLNGDGRLEVVVHWWYLTHGHGTWVYSVAGGEVTRVLSAIGGG